MEAERTTGLTYDDLVRMFPDEDHVRRELIEGELFVTPAPTIRHQRVIMRLAVAMFRYAEPLVLRHADTLSTPLLPGFSIGVAELLGLPEAAAEPTVP